MGSFTVFDAISYFSFFFLIQDFAFSSKRIRTYFFLFWLFLVVLLIGALRSEFIVNSLINIIKFVSIFIYANLLIAEYYNDPTFTVSVVKGLKFAALVSVPFLVVQMVAGLDLLSFYPYLNQNILDSNVVRYPSFFQDPQMYSQFLAISCFLFLIRADNKSPKPQYLNYFFFLVLVFAIFLSGGRSGFLGLCFGLCIVFIAGQNQTRFFIITCVLIGGLVAIYLPNHFSIFSREEGYDEAYEVRHRIWKEAYNVFRISPYWGIGSGNYNKYIQLHSLSGYYVINGEIVYYGTENGYLRTLAESGVIGFIASFLFILVPVASAVKARIKRINNNNIYYLIAGILCWMTASNTLYTLSDKRTLVLLASLICNT